MRRAYLHGLASSPLAKKGQRLKEAFAGAGMDLALPDLNVPSFRALSLRAMLAKLDELDAREGDAQGWGLIGSSLGGWVAARWAEQHPERVARLVLLCPAFDIASRWPEWLPRGMMERWEAKGAIVLPDAEGRPQPFHYGFYREALSEPARPDVRCPTLIVHGTRDERVPIEGSRAYAAAHPNVTLVEVDDGHDLYASLELIVPRALEFLGEPALT